MNGLLLESAFHLELDLSSRLFEIFSKRNGVQTHSVVTEASASLPLMVRLKLQACQVMHASIMASASPFIVGENLT